MSVPYEYCPDKGNYVKRTPEPEASGQSELDSNALLSLVKRWEKESSEYNEIRKAPANENRPTSRSLQMGRSEAYRWCAMELKEFIDMINATEIKDPDIF